MIKDNNKNLQIQVLRAVFCFLIIFFHFTIQYNNYYDCNNIFINPFVDCLDDVGVLSFFILSGFYLMRLQRYEKVSEKQKKKRFFFCFSENMIQAIQK